MNQEQINTIYKIRYNDVVYKIDKVSGNSLTEVKELYAKKFNLDETALKSYDLVAKQEGAENRVLSSDKDVTESLEKATINKKGAKVLTIKLREAQIKQEKAKPKFADWKNLTEEERKTLKEEAIAKAKEFYVIETSDESSSDSSIERGHPGKPLLKKLKQVTMEKIKANPELAKNLPALKQVFAEVKAEMKPHMKDLRKFIGKRCGGRSLSKCKGEWGKERWILFKSLLAKYPNFPGWKVGKIMKKNKGLSETELGALIEEKLNKFVLQTPEQKELYAELRKEFPRMPEFCVNKAIIKNNGDLEKIKKRLYKVREEFKKFLGGFNKRAEHCEKKRHFMDKSSSPDKRSWSKDDYELFAYLCEKFPQMPKWKIGKIQKKNRNLTKQELCDLIQKKLDKFQLDDAGKAKFDELRKEFPHMPEFLINRVICKNKDADIEKLKNRLEKLKTKGKGCKMAFMKGLFEKMGCMKKKLQHMEKSKSQYEGFGPHAYGPMMYGFAPVGYGPHGFGPHGHGPHGHGPHGHGPHGHGPHGFGPHHHGPHGHGPHGFGPHGHGPHRHHRGHKWDNDSSSEEKRMNRLELGFKKLKISDSSDELSSEKSCEKTKILRETFPYIPEKKIKKIIENHPNKDADGLVAFVTERVANTFGKK